MTSLPDTLKDAFHRAAHSGPKRLGRRLLIVAAAGSFGGAALAADPVVFEAPPVPPLVVLPPVSTSYSWSGVYMGLEAGYSWGKSDNSFVPDTNGDTYMVKLDPDGWIGSLYAGYNHHMENNAVIGIEADFTLSEMSSKGIVGTINSIPLEDYEWRSDLDWAVSARARVGYAFDRFLPFITAGYAGAKYEVKETMGLSSFKHFGTYDGWTVGAGIEYAATDNIIVRGQYRYTDFGDIDLLEDFFVASTIDLKSHDLRVGAALKF
ncbi:outer membrane protein [Chelativorans sp. Marseille-P2723]|uniref:outer membrane protein n=1 Tax=Chelativorans sp. Marseille-P2723 TaxID=2709133 RepID=UPI00156FE92B|nr:outer membrane protein [Chelativorans sp. Marseille-P2723]